MADQEPAYRRQRLGREQHATRRSAISPICQGPVVRESERAAGLSVAGAAELDVQFNIGVKAAGDDVHEVVLKIEVTARSDNGVHFVVDLTYAGLFGLRNVPDERSSRSCWSKRRACSSRSRAGSSPMRSATAGFPPLLLEPIDFAAAYMAQLQAQQRGRRRRQASKRRPKPRAKPDLRRRRGRHR